ncbi:Serine/threonine-protein kinase wnk4, partial [Sarracenia purpurea var. burkii]
GKLPRAFYKIKDLEAQTFIGKCLETASKRLSAKELLLDPFLAFAEDDLLPLMKTGCLKPFLKNGNVGIAQLRLPGNPPRTNMTITGKLNPEDDTIFLKVQIADEEGSVRNVYFPFDIASDTPIDVATEMVKELEITDWEPVEIAEMIDGEISALIPHWKEQGQPRLDHCHIPDYQEADDGHHHFPYSFSSCSSSQVSVSGLINSHEMDTHNCDWIADDLFDDTSSQSSLHSGKYSNLNYCSGEEHNSGTSPTRQDRLHCIPNMQKSIRFCQEETSHTRQSLAGDCLVPCKVSLDSQRASTSKDWHLMDRRRLTRNKSLVDMHSQLLHRSLVEEVNKRRMFKTVGAVENIGFQAPY